jgi:hypothetical protein
MPSTTPFFSAFGATALSRLMTSAWAGRIVPEVSLVEER